MKQISMEKDKIKVLLLEGIHEKAVELFKHDGYTNIEHIKTSLDHDTLCDKIKDTHLLGIRSRTQLTEKALRQADKLIAVGCFCIGTNQVDLNAAASKGICVFNAPYSNTRSVAELTLAEIILLLRGIPQKNALCHQGIWQKSAQSSHEVRGKKLGIIGYGNIGTQLSVMAESLGMEVYYYDTQTKLPLGNAVQMQSLKSLLETVDIVTMHVPETPETKNMMTSDVFQQMKKGSLFINNARGSLVDIEALVTALDNGTILGAAIDVFPHEPKSNEDPFVSNLQAYENVILTPHIGGSTLEAQENIGLEVAEKLKKYSDTGTTVSSVNFPEVALPSHANQHRILHIHKNEPGVMQAINQIFADNHINISGQYLQTNNAIGYVVIDVDEAVSELALKEIRQVEHTIKTRRLF